jgi:hypothetical protein
VREVTGVFHSYEALDAAVEALLVVGFDRAEIDRMASNDNVREKIGNVIVASEELGDVPLVPTQPVVLARDIGAIYALVGGAAACAAGVGTALAAAASDMTVVTGVVAGLVAAVVAGSVGIIGANRILNREKIVVRLVHDGPRHRVVGSRPIPGAGGCGAEDPKRSQRCRDPGP